MSQNFLIVPFLCTLANITPVRDHSPAAARKSFLDEGKELRLLDSIALLLVTEEKSDVAAVMLEQTAHGVIFYYSKNQPSTSVERAYLDHLCELALTVSDISQCAMELLDYVIPMCRWKIESRLRRLANCIPSTTDITDDPKTIDEFHKHLVEKMPHLFQETGGLSSRNVLLGYLAQVCNIDHGKCSHNILRKLIRFAHAIGSYHALKDIIHDDTVVRRIRKVGNYYAATKCISKTVWRPHKPNHPRYTAVNISFHEVEAPKQTATYIYQDQIGMLNRFGTTCGLDHVSRVTMKATYPSAFSCSKARGSYGRVTLSIHAECTLAMHALALRRDWASVKIGVSTGSCWLCEKFLNHLSARGVRFLVSDFNGKVQPGWTCPPGLDTRDRDVITTVVGDALKEIIENVLNSRRSDSSPHAASDGERSGASPEEYDDDDLQWLANALGGIGN